MQENEFERRLQDEMSGFRVRPSEVVWDKIEEQLRRKKRRRIIFYVFLLVGLSVVGYSGYFLFSTQEPIITEQDVANTNEKSGDGLKPSTSHDQTKKTNPVSENNEQQNKPVNSDNDSQAQTKIPNNADNQVARQIRQTGDLLTELKSSRPSSSRNLKATKNNTATTGNKTIATPGEQNLKPLAEAILVPTADLSISNIKADQQVTSEKNETKIVKPDSAIAAIEKQDQKLSVTQTQPTKKTKLSIRWGLELSGGMSQLNNKAFSFSGVNQQADAFYNNGPSNNPGTGSLSSSRQSEVLRGAAFKTAVVGEMSVSKRSSVSAGLGYAYYSNETTTGIYKDSNFVLRTMTDQSVALNSYYQGSQVIEYTNKYHFIQVPISFHVQLNKGIKVPIKWNIGLSPAYLFSTNALVYDTASGGIYYKNKDAFNKFHFNLNTGISFWIGKPNKLQWSIGPEISMDMTGLVKDAVQKRYFLYGGISGRVYFKKKNP